LGELEKEAEFQKVNVKVKIGDVSEAVTLGNKSRIQKVTVLDESGTRDLTLWENDIGKQDARSGVSLRCGYSQC
jgi:hypothetical protein